MVVRGVQGVGVSRSSTRTQYPSMRFQGLTSKGRSMPNRRGRRVVAQGDLLLVRRSNSSLPSNIRSTNNNNSSFRLGPRQVVGICTATPSRNNSSKRKDTKGRGSNSNMAARSLCKERLPGLPNRRTEMTGVGEGGPATNQGNQGNPSHRVRRVLGHPVTLASNSRCSSVLLCFPQDRRLLLLPLPRECL